MILMIASHVEALSPSPGFLRNGFAVLEGFLDESVVARAHVLVERILASPRDSACVRPHNTLVPLRWNDCIVQTILVPQRGVNVLRDALPADDLRWISGYVSIKEPHSPALWWHQDWWCWDHSVSYQPTPPQVAVLIYLSKTTANNGALRVLPGSHLKSVPIHAELPHAHFQAVEHLEADNVAMRELPGQVTLCASAGDAVVTDYRLLHGTHGNASHLRRDCIILNFTPSWRSLPDDIKAHLIGHPAQPSRAEIADVPPGISALLPTFNGTQRDLTLNRNAPATFEIAV